MQENPGLDDFGDNNRFKLIEYEYDLISGNVNKVHYQSGKEDQFHHKYYYDADNRLLAVFTSRDNHIWDKDARYFYYRHGPLARTEIGDLKVQGVDYAYTIHGWLKGVNATALNTAKDMGKDAKYAGPLSSSNSYVGSDAFGFVLDYYKGDYNRINSSAPDFVATQQSGGTYYTYYDPSNTTAPDLWNGNIRGMSTALMDPDHVKVNVLGKSYQYDQLNRIKASYSFEKASMDLTANFTWVGVSASNNWNTSYTYDPNGNLTTMNRSGNNNTAYDMDQFTYHYYQGTENSNRLKYVSDAATGSYDEDIDNQTGAATDNMNYEYDEIGNLTKDVTGDLENIEWTVYGKIHEIEKGDGTIITFAYDPTGQRIMKKVDPTSGNTVYTYYLRDAQGNNMATYERIDAETTDELFLTEQYVYGSSRVGYVSLNYEMVDATPSTTNFVRRLGEKRYELSNHLGNVLAVVTDRLFAYQEASPYTNHVKYYEADVISAQDYDLFGMLTHGRTWQLGSGNAYRYGFNGQEKEFDLIANSPLYFAEFWEYDSRLGKRWNLDPVIKHFESPYSTFGNNPIFNIDPLGDNASSHTDEDGNVIAVYNDGDNGVYKHTGKGDEALKSLKTKYSSTNTSAGGTKMGESFRWDEFAKHDGATGELMMDATGNYIVQGKIHFGESIEATVASLNSTVKKEFEAAKAEGKDELLAFYNELAEDSKKGGQYDIKSWYTSSPTSQERIPNDGFLFQGKYITVESAGNYLAGLNAASVKPKLVPAKTWYLIGAQKAGQAHMLQHKNKLNGKMPEPTCYFGETEYTGRMFWEGFKSVYKIASPKAIQTEIEAKWQMESD